MRNINNPSLIGTSTAGLETFVMGTHNWTIRNDENCKELKSTLLTLSTCKETEFTCRNGLCIDIEKRCNARTDCRDKSDEVGCLRINPDESYQKYIAPLPPSNQNSSKIIIEVSEDIVDILEIDEKASIFQVQFYLHFSWLDSRLTFFDLCNNPGLNNLSPQEKELLWIPVLVFENTENKVTTLVDNEATITIGKEGESYLSGLDEFNNREYYRGAENLIKLSRFYNTRFLCQYDLRWYPFDIQNCQLQFTMFGESGDFSTLESKLLNFFGERSSKEFVVENFFMRVSEDNGKTTLKVNVILGRNLLPIALNTYLPSILLITISYATVFFKPFFFEATVTVNLTTLLVLVTLFVSVSNSLPPTSYMKMVDIYLIFCLFIPFVIVLLNTIMDYLRISPASGSAPISNQDDVTETERRFQIKK
ncbi:gamma-aminobutyric acid receptor subunit beta-like [Eurytemora carolleeae]|uniref:gamma-aminobutyric acid receptor subunit beta-like n=1 Tax=Eurytemora carolleeae TaxID=1294199 RepID=UPI000C787C2D|nr:gamma-aminobutyric acid receptor subunit beta-like [Eurytemora carolleeae]XP_023329747.1 gamma-aminobutyric acid receptor subunit beta-like [Eurytemora carolleeae]|eukprot:XP_023329745.1 gamma-aminobutyric acid receptor subunit beta-like [Eurytemora affinis]